ncbi:MAG TPA: hypothetical protein VFX63_14065 [Pyrinomonadaceae bacterium]|nr:hypothetical protein [Pyrinomonadaceae bacterium]
MNNTGRHGEKSGYLVIMLLVVGLTAFSHSMKELTEIQQLTLDASRLVAQWSGNVTPAEIPQVPQIAQTVVKIEKHQSCQSRQSAPAVDLPWLTAPAPVAPARKQIKNERTSRPAILSEAQIAKLKKLNRVDIDADSFEVRVPAIQLPDSDESGATEFPAFTFKTKTRKPGALRINPRDREILLKTLNRSINLRIAS